MDNEFQTDNLCVNLSETEDTNAVQHLDKYNTSYTTQFQVTSVYT
jgi:hypothetical protein